MLHYLLPLYQFLGFKILVTGLISLLLYVIYFKICRFYIWRQSKFTTTGKKNIGRTIPAFPNGWYCLMSSVELKPGQTEYIDRNGRNIVLFRGTDRIAYCLDAYCAHMGANLAIGGTVKYDKCIQCPFHGWVFDGETGNCVMGSKLTQKQAIRYEYCEDFGDSECKEVINTDGKLENVKIKSYLVKEISGYIYIWLHSVEEKRLIDPPYYPLDISDTLKRLDHRGYSMNLVNTHVQDIAENGADILHFNFIHKDIIPNFIKGIWKPNWIKASDPNLKEILKHKKQDINDLRMNLIDKYINESNKDYIGIVTLENSLSILGSEEFFFF